MFYYGVLLIKISINILEFLLSFPVQMLQHYSYSVFYKLWQTKTQNESQHHLWAAALLLKWEYSAWTTLLSDISIWN